MPLRLVMMGTGTFPVPTLRALWDGPHAVVGLVTQPQRPAAHQQRSLPNATEDLARERGVPILQPDDIKSPEAIEAVLALRPDLLVVAAYGQILPEALLDAVPHGGINLHASLLPRYRGAAPIAWAIYHGETRTGVTVIAMKARIDAGPILAAREVEVRPDETAGELEERLAEIGAALVCEVVDRIEAGTIAAKPQDPSLATRAPKLRKEHGEIQWSRSAAQIANQIRAMLPWPTAYTYWLRPSKPPTRLILLLAHAADDRGGSARAIAALLTGAGPERATAGLPSSAEPGTVVVAENGRIEVATGQGRLMIEELQPAGKRRMTAEEFLRGYRLTAGDRLGPAE